MKEIIQHFNEVCINELLKVSKIYTEIQASLLNTLEELKETLNKLGVEIIKETRRDGYGNKKQCKRKMNWHVEKKDYEKDLITTLGTVSFMKTLYVSKEKE